MEFGITHTPNGVWDQTLNKVWYHITLQTEFGIAHPPNGVWDRTLQTEFGIAHFSNGDWDRTLFKRILGSHTLQTEFGIAHSPNVIYDHTHSKHRLGLHFLVFVMPSFEDNMQLCTCQTEFRTLHSLDSLSWHTVTLIILCYHTPVWIAFVWSHTLLASLWLHSLNGICDNTSSSECSEFWSCRQCFLTATACGVWVLRFTASEAKCSMRLFGVVSVYCSFDGYFSTIFCCCSQHTLTNQWQGRRLKANPS